MSGLKPISIEGEDFFFGFGFDIDDFIGDGVWWLQICNGNRELIYDQPFASSMGSLDMERVKQIIKGEFLTPKGGVL